MFTKTEYAPNIIVQLPLVTTLDYKVRLLQAQPTRIQKFFHDQSWIVIQDIEDRKQRLRFNFPDMILLPLTDRSTEFYKASIPPRHRHQQVGRYLRWNSSLDVIQNLIDHLEELGKSKITAVARCAELLRYLIAVHLLESLPKGETAVCRDHTEIVKSDIFPLNTEPIRYDPMQGESLQMEDGAKKQYFFSVYIPQWIAFDHQGALPDIHPLEVDERMHSMENYMRRLSLVLAIEPAMLDNQDFQHRYLGMSEQWKYQGRAYAHYQTLQIIRSIRQRVQENSLNRGLSLSLPYFNEQALKICLFEFEIIPSGRILFDPSFINDAVETANVNVLANLQLDGATKKNLLTELELVQKSFAIHLPFTPIGMFLQANGFIGNNYQKVQRRISH